MDFYQVHQRAPEELTNVFVTYSVWHKLNLPIGVALPVKPKKREYSLFHLLLFYALSDNL